MSSSLWYLTLHTSQNSELDEESNTTRFIFCGVKIGVTSAADSVLVNHSLTGANLGSVEI